MAYNFEFIREKYQYTDKEDGRFLESRAAGLEAHYTKRQLDLLVGKQSSVLELGCATGYYGLYDRMAESEYCTGLSNHALLVCGKKDM